MNCAYYMPTNTGSGGFTGAAPVAGFDMADNPTPRDSLVTFTDTSSNVPTAWTWKCNGAVFSTDQNPVKYFNTPGTFVIELTVSNAFGSDVTSASLFVQSGGALP